MFVYTIFGTFAHPLCTCVGLLLYVSMTVVFRILSLVQVMHRLRPSSRLTPSSRR